MCAVWRHTLRRTVSGWRASPCCLPLAPLAMLLTDAAYVNVRDAANDDIATRCYTFVHARLFVPAYLISFNIG
ncbi:hypothetical protein BTO02_10690 [Paraburkholderia sp. SOS3]|nr:hypothetical protein BTO02_10690 [Paraburkholderia sp. SOS3]